MTFRDQISWIKAIDLAVLVFNETANFPADEKFGLRSQMRRAAYSIPSNLAEGYGRGGRIEYLRFIDIAMGSLRELQTQIEISKRLGFLKSDALELGSDEVGRIIYSVRRTLKAKGDPKKP
ncbi:MAG: four helix bundle protein [Armatimonadota bacterium]